MGHGRKEPSHAGDKKRAGHSGRGGSTCPMIISSNSSLARDMERKEGKEERERRKRTQVLSRGDEASHGSIQQKHKTPATGALLSISEVFLEEVRALGSRDEGPAGDLGHQGGCGTEGTSNQSYPCLP